jgi:DNA polymerase III subunit beta
MKVNRSALSAVLRDLVRLAPTKPTIPILSNLHLRAANGALEITATEGDTFLTAALPCEGDIDICVSAKTLAAVVKPEGKPAAADAVEIDALSETTVSVAVDGLSTRLATLPPEEFPVPPPTDEISLVALWPAAGLRAALAYVIPAVSDDQTRPNLVGVCMKDAVVAATDGHRLHAAPLPTQIAEPLFLHTSAANALERALDNAEHVVLARHGDVLCARCGKWKLVTRLKSETFPPADQVIPSLKSLPTRIEVEPKVLAKALARVSRVSSRRSVKVSVNGVITLATSDIDLGDAETVVPVLSNTHTGDDLVTGFNAAYLADALTDTKSVTLSMCGPLDPLRVDSDGGRIAVVMPLSV